MPKAFNIITKPIGPKCNLDCTYCFYLEKEKLFPEKEDFRMSEEKLESYIRQYIESQDINQINFTWQGGEPTLLGLEFFKRVVELQKKYADGKQVDNGFQTNGILLDVKWCDFFKTNNFLIGLSIDGPEHLHDIYRVNKGGKPTFRHVTRGADYLKKHNVQFNTLTVIQKSNSYYPHEVYQFLKEIGSGFMQFIPIVERIADRSPEGQINLVSPNYKRPAQVAGWSVEAEQYGKFLCTVFDEWVRNDVGSVFVQLFDVSLEAWLGMMPGLCVFRETCGEALAMEHNGDLYSCDHYVYPENKLGNIMDSALNSMVYSEQQLIFGKNKQLSLPKYCRECEVRFICHGECPKHRFIKTPDGEDGLNYLCAGYKMFFNHVDPYMKFMANQLQAQKSPADVMAWSGEKDAGFPSIKPKVNDPCPCRSGLKFKKCCGILH